MPQLPARLLLLPLGLSWLALTACGGEDDSDTDTSTSTSVSTESQDLCEEVDCGDNASCAPDTGECHCDEGFDDIDGDCLDERLVDCHDRAPANATSEVEQVSITFDGQEWSEPEDCAWSCDSGFGEWEGECLDSRVESCVDESPEGATAEVVDVSIAYVEGDGWEPVPACEWSCDPGLGEWEGECRASILVECRDEAPENGFSTIAEVELIFNAETGEWPEPPACVWSCDPGFGEHEDMCLTSREISCDPSGTPENATADEVDVVIAWLEDESRWADPEACVWTCDPEYGFWEDLCLQEAMTTCQDEPPEHAVSTEPLPDVEVTFDPSTGEWSEAEQCPWECIDGFHLDEVDPVCVANVDIGSCWVQWPLEVETWADWPTTYYGVVESTAPVEDDRAIGLRAQWCEGPAPISVDTPIEELSCAVATYNVDADPGFGFYEFFADGEFEAAGDREYLFAFSGNGGASWRLCDRTERPGEPFATGPGVAWVLGNPPNPTFDEWDDESGRPVHWSFSPSLGTEQILREGDDDPLVFSGESSMLAIRNSITPSANDIRSGRSPIDPTAEYDFTIWFLDDDPTVRANVNIEWIREDGTTITTTYGGTYTADSEEWQSIVRTLSPPSEAAYARIASRLYAQDSAPPGGTIIYGAASIKRL